MSADNGLIAREMTAGWRVVEYDASSGSEYVLADMESLDEATRFAAGWMQENVVEYGVRFDFLSSPQTHPASPQPERDPRTS